MSGAGSIGDGLRRGVRVRGRRSGRACAGEGWGSRAWASWAILRRKKFNGLGTVLGHPERTSVSVSGRSTTHPHRRILRCGKHTPPLRAALATLVWLDWALGIRYTTATSSEIVWANGQRRSTRWVAVWCYVDDKVGGLLKGALNSWRCPLFLSSGRGWRFPALEPLRAHPRRSALAARRDAAHALDNLRERPGEELDPDDPMSPRELATVRKCGGWAISLARARHIPYPQPRRPGAHQPLLPIRRGRAAAAERGDRWRRTSSGWSTSASTIKAEEEQRMKAATLALRAAETLLPTLDDGAA